MKKIIYIIIFLISNICFSQSLFNLDNITELGKYKLNDSIKNLIFFDYPKKWYTHIDENPFYDSVKDSLSQKYYDNLCVIEDSIYNSLKEVIKYDKCINKK